MQPNLLLVRRDLTLLTGLYGAELCGYITDKLTTDLDFVSAASQVPIATEFFNLGIAEI